MKNKGFTLIELLAVLVIISVLAFITIPIVLKTVDESEKSSYLISGENYAKAVEGAISLGKINGQIAVNGIYEVMDNGNLCLGAEIDNECPTNIIKIETKGNRPTSGFVYINSNIITQMSLYYDEYLITKTGENSFIHPEYEIGEQISFDPGDGVNINWNVIGETENTVTLMLNKNIYYSIWGPNDEMYENYNKDGTVCADSFGICTDEGPLGMLYFLKAINSGALDISTWENIEPIKSYEFYNDSNISYKKLEIIDGRAMITDDNYNKEEVFSKSNFSNSSGLIATYDLDDEKFILNAPLKTREISFEEFYNIIVLANPGIEEYFSDKTFDDNFDIVADEFKSEIQTAADKGMELKNWDDVKNFWFEQNLNYTNPTYTDKLMLNIFFLTNKESGLNIPTTVDINIPSFLNSNLVSGDEFGDGYYMLNSLGLSFVPAVSVDNFHLAYLFSYSPVFGIRPVIEVSKDKLN